MKSGRPGANSATLKVTVMKKNTTTLTRARILKALRDHDETLKKYSVMRIGLFGSYARGKQRRGPDIDFLVEFEKPTYDNFYDLIVYLEKMFGRKVEVLTPDGVDSIRVPEVAQSIRDSVVYV
jgi:predicted nucleotidyltransferase